MENGKNSAHPINDLTTVSQMGLTKREYFAAMAMQGILSNPNRGYQVEKVVAASLEYADGLLNEIEKIK